MAHEWQGDSYGMGWRLLPRPDWVPRNGDGEKGCEAEWYFGDKGDTYDVRDWMWGKRKETNQD